MLSFTVNASHLYHTVYVIAQMLSRLQHIVSFAAKAISPLYHIISFAVNVISPFTCKRFFINSCCISPGDAAMRVTLAST